MDERDRIDIIATLHDRFREPAEKIISKMEEMENQADETGDSIDELEENLAEESKTTRQNTKDTEANTKGRRRNTDAVDAQGKKVQESTRRLRDHNRAVVDNLRPLKLFSQMEQESASAASESAKAVSKDTEAHKEHSDAVQRAARSINTSTRNIGRARDEFVRFTSAIHTSRDAMDQHTESTHQNTRAHERHTRSVQHDHDAWVKWDAKIRKITSGFSDRFRPIGAFYQNYFKILGAFRAIMFTDIGALIPQLITGLVALGAAFNASLAPAGRVLGSFAQMVPFMAAYGQTLAVTKIAIGGVSDALKVLSNDKATAEELAKAQKEAGDNTWAMAKAVKQLTQDFKPLNKAIREAFFDGMAPALRDLVDYYFPTLKRNLTETAQIMNGELKQGMESLQTPEKRETIANVMERSSVASGLFVDIMWSLLDVFIELADAAGPSFLRTLEAIDYRLDQFAGWISDNKTELTGFFDRAGRSAGNFLKGVGFILVGLAGIAGAAKPLEDFLYGGLLDRLEGWSEKMNDPKQQEIMAENYENMIPNLEAIGNLIGAIIDGAKEISNSEYFAPLVNDLADKGIPTIVAYFKELDRTVGPPLLRITDALDDIDPDVMVTVLAPLGDMLGLLASVLELVVPLFNAMPEPMQEVVTYGLGLAAMGLPSIFLLLGGAIKFLTPILKIAGGLFRFLLRVLIDIIESPFAKKIGALFKPIIDFILKYAPRLVSWIGPVARFLGKKSFAVIPVIGTLIAVLWTVWDVLKWLWDNVKPFRDFFTGLWDWVVQAWNASIDWIVNTAVPWIVDAFTSIWDTLKDFGAWLLGFYNDWIKPVVDGFIWLGKLVFVIVGTLIIAPFVILWNILSPIFKAIWDWFVDKLPSALAVLGDAWDATTKFLSGAWDGVKLVFLLVVGAIVSAAQWLWDGVVRIFNGIVNGVIGAATWMWDGIVGILTWIKDAWDTAWNWMLGVVTFVWTWMKDNVINPVINWFMIYVWPTINSIIGWIVNAWNWFLAVISGVWAWIKDMVVGPTVNWFMTWVWPTISGVIQWIGDKFTWVKDTVVNVWNAIKDTIVSVYWDHIHPIFDKFGEVLDSLEDSFRVARDSIGIIWDGLKAKVAGPAQYVVDVVYNNGIRAVWNKLAETVDLGVTLPLVQFDTAGIAVKKGIAAAKAGLKGFDTGGYTGAGSKYTPAGVVHADEFVIRKESQRSLRREAPGLLDDLNKHGARALHGFVTGYAKGGLAESSALAAQMGLRKTSGFRQGARTAQSGSVSLHALGKAYDFAGSASQMMAFFNAMDRMYDPTELLYSPAGARNIHRGGYRGPNTGKTLKNHFNHVHVGFLDGAATVTGDGGGGGGFTLNPFQWVRDKFEKEIPEKFPESGKFVDLSLKFGDKVIGSVGDFVNKKMEQAGNFISDAADTGINVAGKGVQLAGAGTGRVRWTPVATRALMSEGVFTPANLDSLMNRMYQESSYNPEAINKTDSNAKKGTPSKGLMQVIQPTFNRYRDPNLPNDIWDPMANIVASIRYARARYGDIKKGYNRRGGYSAGGLVIDHMRFLGGPVETWGNTLVGELGPELFMPADGSPASLLGVYGPEVVSFDREGAIAPHRAVAAMSAYNDNLTEEHHSTSEENSYYDVSITVQGGGSMEQDIRSAVRAAIAEIERKKRERS